MDAVERQQVSLDVASLTVAPRRDWVLGRVAALLSQYYAADLPQSIVKVMADDWAEALCEYPEWAITKAVRWWKSEANAERKRKPLEGDIAARARYEMGIVKVAEGALRRFDSGVLPYVGGDNSTGRVEPTEEQRKRMADYQEEAGFAPKRFGGAA